MSRQKRWILYMVGIFILFLAGVTTGYYAWGIDHQDPVDYKKLLYRTASYIAGLEDQINASGKPYSDTSDIGQTIITDTDANGDNQLPSGDQTSQRKLPTKASATTEENSPAVEQDGNKVNPELQNTHRMPNRNSQPQEIIAALMKTRAALEEENTVLRSAISDNQNLITGKEQLQEENNRLTEKLAQLESKNTEMEASATRAEELATENTKLQDEIVLLSDEIAALKTRLSKISVLVKDENSQNEASSQESSASTERPAVTNTQE